MLPGHALQVWHAMDVRVQVPYEVPMTPVAQSQIRRAQGRGQTLSGCGLILLHNYAH